MNRRLSVGLCLVALATPAAVLAQTFPDEEPASKFQFGPLGLTPRIALKNLGFDTNPLNRAENPDRDFTATIVPGLDSTLRAGRGLFTGKTTVEWNYFNESRTQRSLNFGQEGRVALDFYRVMPYVGGSYLSTRQRPNLEIDLRVQQHTTMADVGTALRVGSRFRFDVEGRRTTYEFGEGTRGDLLVQYALDRRSDLGSVATRFAVTPLTTFVVRTEFQQDRFRFTPLRDSDSVTVLPGFELKPSALVSGKVMVGYRHFDALDANVFDYTGLVAKVDAKYVMRQATQFTFQADRNVDYSVEFTQPYFIATGGTLSVMQILGEDWYATGRFGRSRLAYRNVVDAGTALGVAANRTDRVNTYGVGVGRLLGSDLRVGVDVDHTSRTSVIPSREYEGFRFGGTISYGFQ